MTEPRGDRAPVEQAASITRFVIGYIAVAIFVLVGALIAFTAGDDREAAPELRGIYELESPCLGDRFVLRQSGEFLNIVGPGGTGGKLRVDGRGSSAAADGSVSCRDGSEEPVEIRPFALSSNSELTGTLGGEPFTARRTEELTPRAEATAAADVEAGAVGEAAAEEERPSGETLFGRLMLAIAAVILAARLVGAAIARLGQPRVMGEVLAGILLGPTLLGAIAPDVKEYLFPDFVIPLLVAGAYIGLAFYMFLVGLELDPALLRGRIQHAAFISNASVAIPMTLGLLLAIPLYDRLAPDQSFAAFALFMGVAMSVTAFPVLARILVERRMLRRPLGALSMAAAAVDDVTAWGLLALASAVAGAGSGSKVVQIIALAILFVAAMALIVRRLLSRVSRAYDEAGHVPPTWIGIIFVGVLLSAYGAYSVGIAPIFGAFVMGLIMPRRADLSHDITRRFEDFVVTVMLPLFFVVTGLRTEIGLLDRPELWLIAALILGVAILAKWGGAMFAARYGGMRWKESTGLGILMNTRGLTELIVLNIALEAGVITPSLFTALVVMALITTFMTGPLLRLVDRAGEFSAPPEEELQRAATGHVDVKTTGGAILVAPQDARNIDPLLELAEPLASSEPRRELIVARLILSDRLLTGVALDTRELAEENAALERRRVALLERGVAARAVAFNSAAPGADLARLAEREDVDLLLIDGRRPLLGSAVPRGAVGEVLEKVPCDVAVLVERRAGEPILARGAPIVVPFGGAEHDWAALELGAWISTAHGSPLRLLGAAAADGDGRPGDASRLLANASLVLQQLAGISAEPLLVEPGEAGILSAAEGAGLLVIGLSPRWRKEGLGPVRAEIARSAAAPTLFVRRGTRPGLLAPPDDVTRFRWSMAGPIRTPTG